MLFISAVSAGILSVHLGQDCNWDLRNYHVYNGYSFLKNRLLFDVAPAQIQSFLNPVMHVPFYLAVKNLRPVAVGFLIGGIQGINIWLVYKMAFLAAPELPALTRYFLSAAAAITGFTGAASISETGTAMGDNIISILILAGLLLTVQPIQKPITKRDGNVFPSWRISFLAGMMMGAAAGLKLTAFIYLLPFLLALLSVRTPLYARARNLFVSLSGAASGFLLISGYWMLVLWKHFKNPVFPFFNGFFKSGFYPVSDFADKRFMPRNLLQSLFYPFYFSVRQTLASELPLKDMRLAMCYLVLLLFLSTEFYRLAKSRCLKMPVKIRTETGPDNFFAFMAVFFIFSYILWQKMFSIYRYAAALEILSPVFILLTLKRIIPAKKVFYPILSTIIFAYLVFNTSAPEWGRVPWSRDYFDVRIPDMKRFDDSTIIMLGYDPLSYIIPYFPESARFVRVQSTFVNPGSKNKNLTSAKIARLLGEARNGRIYLLTGKNCRTQANEAILRSYGLKPDNHFSAEVRTKFDELEISSATHKGTLIKNPER